MHVSLWLPPPFSSVVAAAGTPAIPLRDEGLRFTYKGVGFARPSLLELVSIFIEGLGPPFLILLGPKLRWERLHAGWVQGMKACTG